MTLRKLFMGLSEKAEVIAEPVEMGGLNVVIRWRDGGRLGYYYSFFLGRDELDRELKEQEEK